MIRLLAVLPGPTVRVELAAVIAETDATATRRASDELDDASPASARDGNRLRRHHRRRTRASHRRGGHHRTAPARVRACLGATVSPDQVRVRYAKKLAIDAPAIDTDGEFDASTEPAVFAHYGLTYVTGAVGERHLATRYDELAVTYRAAAVTDEPPAAHADGHGRTLTVPGRTVLVRQGDGHQALAWQHLKHER